MIFKEMVGGRERVTTDEEVWPSCVAAKSALCIIRPTVLRP